MSSDERYFRNLISNCTDAQLADKGWSSDEIRDLREIFSKENDD